MGIYIFGAQGIALGMYRAIKALHPRYVVDGFLVTDKHNNPEILDGIDVIEINEISTEMDKDSCEIFICTPENVMNEVESILNKAGFYNVIRITSLRWAKMQEYANLKNGECIPLSAYPIGGKKATIRIFKAKFYKDQNLLSTYKHPDFFVDIQVGKALTNICVSEIADNQGDNISDRNGNYSELTGLYWIWKNCLQVNENEIEYYGLAHYRRFLELSDDDLYRMCENDIDVILPYPMPYVPNVEEHPKRYLSEYEWLTVKKVIAELYPECIKDFDMFIDQQYMYNYNIIIAKKAVLNDYCSWLFSILFRVEEILKEQDLNEPHRYLGYIGEELESFYFMRKRNVLNIVHAGCHFLT